MDVAVRGCDAYNALEYMMPDSHRLLDFFQHTDYAHAVRPLNGSMYIRKYKPHMDLTTNCYAHSHLICKGGVRCMYIIRTTHTCTYNASLHFVYTNSEKQNLSAAARQSTPDTHLPKRHHVPGAPETYSVPRAAVASDDMECMPSTCWLKRKSCRIRLA